MSIIDLFRFKRVGEFKKVSFKSFSKEMSKYVSTEIIPVELYKDIYDNIVIPYRKTIDSMGHDFVAPFDIDIKPGESVTIPLGIRWKATRGWGLLISVRSGLGKYRIQLDDTIPAIDGDFYYTKTEGNIIITLTNDNRDNFIYQIRKDSSFIQGFIIPYGVDKNDWKKPKQIRTGGFGSTGKQDSVIKLMD